MIMSEMKRTEGGSNYMDKMLNVIMNIQSELKAPKGNYNSFGNYKYRSCEDILEAVKPLLKENNAALTLSDEIVEVGGRVYVRATATLMAEENTVSVTAYAREAETKKGMDDSQITGTASSYARKYALNGLFCIDDTKDADTDEYARRTSKKAPKSDEEDFDGSEIITAKQAKDIESLAVQVGKDVKAMCDYFGVEDCKHMTKKMYAQAHAMLIKKVNQNG